MKNKNLCILLSSLLALGGISNANAKESYIPRPNIFHKVEKGDTLIKLAERYYKDGSLYDELSEYNGRAYPDYIYIGELIRIPDIQILLGNVDEIDQYGCTPVNFENPKDLNWKYYEMIEGDTFNGVYYKFYKDIFNENPGLENNLNHKELRQTLHMFNGIEDDWNLQIGKKIYLMGFDHLVNLTNELKTTNKLIKTR